MLMPIIELQGCTPEPLMNYLKALGVLRIIVEQGLDATARGFWKNHVFCLRTQLTEDQIVEFFATRYQPSPILSPWNGAGGFEKARGADVTAIAHLRGTSDPRLSDFQKAIREVDALKLASPKMEKNEILLAVRNSVPDGLLHWFDACTVSVSSKFSYAPYLGTGGNVGKLELSINFIKNVLLVFKDPKSAEWGAFRIPLIC